MKNFLAFLGTIVIINQPVVFSATEEQLRAEEELRKRFIMIEIAEGNLNGNIKKNREKQASLEKQVDGILKTADREFGNLLLDKEKQNKRYDELCEAYMVLTREEGRIQGGLVGAVPTTQVSRNAMTQLRNIGRDLLAMRQQKAQQWGMLDAIEVRIKQERERLMGDLLTNSLFTEQLLPLVEGMRDLQAEARELEAHQQGIIIEKMDLKLEAIALEEAHRRG